MKYTYIALVVVMGLAASFFIYNYESNGTEDIANSTKNQSSKLARGINACKNARLEIDDNIFQLKNEIAEIPNIESPENKITLKYASHAVRGTMDSGSVNDMVCIYNLTDGSLTTKTYVAVLLGLTEDTYAPFATMLLGENISVSDMQIINGKANIEIKDNNTKETSVKTIFIDGDLLSVLEK